MESQKRNLRARNPLSDCTNTVASSHSPASNFSSVIKPRKRVSILASASASASASFNLQVSNPSSDSVPTGPNPSSDCIPTEPNPSSDWVATEPSSSSLPAEASTPSREVDLPSSSGTDRVSEPQSFYSRRHHKKRRKSTAIEITPYTFATASKIHTMGEKKDGYSSPSKARTVPCKKRQRGSMHGEDESKIELPREFVEQQKAYFAEVDAFDLPVEEAKSSDSE